MGIAGRKSTRRWAFCLGLLAILLQLAAVGVPMPAMADGAPDWLAGSLCRGDFTPAEPNHPVCPVCFVLSQAAGAAPPAVATLAAPHVPAPPAPSRDSLRLSSAPSGVPQPRGPPVPA